MGRWDEAKQEDADTGQPATTAGRKGCDPHSGDGFPHGHKFQQPQEQGGMGQPTGHWAVQGQGARPAGPHLDLCCGLSLQRQNDAVSKLVG